MYRVSKEFRFEAAHRLLHHKGKCRDLHGHSYRAVVVVESDFTDNLGMVVDFGILKERVGGWINANWDHNYIANHNDPYVAVLPRLSLESRIPYCIPADPTAENLARYLYVISDDILKDVDGISVVSVTIHETETCSASYSKE